MAKKRQVLQVHDGDVAVMRTGNGSISVFFHAVGINVVSDEQVPGTAMVMRPGPEAIEEIPGRVVAVCFSPITKEKRNVKP